MGSGPIAFVTTNCCTAIGIKSDIHTKITHLNLSMTDLSMCPCGDGALRKEGGSNWTGRFLCPDVDMNDASGAFFWDACWLCPKGKLAVGRARLDGTPLPEGRIAYSRDYVRRIRNSNKPYGLTKKDFVRPKLEPKSLEDMREDAGI